MSQANISPILNRVGQLVQSASTNLGYVLGSFYQDWVLAIVNWTTLPYILLAFVLVFVPLKLILKTRARQYLPLLGNGVRQVGEGGCNIVIGGLGAAWVNLTIGLSPFFLTVPLTLVIVGLYPLLIADVFLLKRIFRKAAGLDVEV